MASDNEHQAATAPPKEKFTLLFEMLKFYYSSPLDGLVRTSAILLVIAGWMASSESVQRQLDSNPLLRWWGLAFIVVGESLYIYISWRVYLLSSITFDLLKSLGYMDVKYYDNYRIRRRVIAVYWLASILIAASAGTLVFKIKPQPTAANSVVVVGSESAADPNCPGVAEDKGEFGGRRLTRSVERTSGAAAHLQ